MCFPSCQWDFVLFQLIDKKRWYHWKVHRWIDGGDWHLVCSRTDQLDVVKKCTEACSVCVCSVVFSTQGEEIGLLRGLVVVRTFSYFQKPRMRIQWLSVFQVVSSCFQEMVLRFVLMTKKTLGPLFSFVFLGVLRDMHQVPWRAEVDGEFFRCFACLELVCLLWILDS